MEEAQISRKLIVSLGKMKKYPSTLQHMQVLETFRNYIRPADMEFTKQLAVYTTKFLSAKNHNGYAPYQLEYGVGPVDPYYDEPEETGSDTSNLPCTNIDNCRHEEGCNYPRCLHLQSYGEPTDPLITYNIPAFHFQQAVVQYLDTHGNDTKVSEETRSIPANEKGIQFIPVRFPAALHPFPQAVQLCPSAPRNCSATLIKTVASRSDSAIVASVGIQTDQ